MYSIVVVCIVIIVSFLIIIKGKIITDWYTDLFMDGDYDNGRLFGLYLIKRKDDEVIFDRRLLEGNFRIKGISSGKEFAYKGKGSFSNIKEKKETDISCYRPHDEFLIGSLEGSLYVPIGLIKSFYSFDRLALNSKLYELDSIVMGSIMVFNFEEFIDSISIKKRNFIWVAKLNIFSWGKKNIARQIGIEKAFYW